MRIETFPLIAGVIIALIGFGLIIDARLPDRAPRMERRRRTRRERNRSGELLIGLGVIALAAAIAGRDTWRYSILSTIIGAALVLRGALMNRAYLGELITNRGANRRRSAPDRNSPAPGSRRSSGTGEGPAPEGADGQPLGSPGVTPPPH